MLSALTRLRWWATIHWRLSGGELYPFRGVPEAIVRKWACNVRPRMREDQVDVVLAARDELEQRGHRWVDAPEVFNSSPAPGEPVSWRRDEAGEWSVTKRFPPEA